MIIRRVAAAALVLAAALAAPAAGPDGIAVSPADAVIGSASTADFSADVVYQIVTDRFHDGNTGNNNPTNSSGLYSADKSNWRYYFGGDWDGITAKIPYLAAMGITAIWISPGVFNVNVPVPIGGSNHSGYHGFWGMDFFVPEPHFGTWTDFDDMISTAHSNGIKVVLDFAPNHSSPTIESDSSYAVDGKLLNNGTEVTRYHNDSAGYFHHNGDISNWDDLYEVQYKSMVGLADLKQEASPAHTYMRDAIVTWLNRGVDGIRMDAVKLMPLGWQKTYTDHIYANRSVFLFGEWFDTSSSPLWTDVKKFANTSGMSILNFDLNAAIRSAFMGGSMVDLDTAVQRTDAAFTWQNQQVNFVDNHDITRFLSSHNNTARLDQAQVFVLTARGVPTVYYGDEQYLHNDTNSGNDPYNRPMMTTFDQTTRGFKIVQKLSDLRRNNAAVRFGSIGQRWLNSDVYIYERKFNSDVVLVALNKSTTTSYNITGLNTSLPAGTYGDVLTGLLDGGSITVTTGSGGNNPVNSFTLGANDAAVWSYSSANPLTPQVGNISPTVGRSGNAVAITGRGFGTTTGSVSVGGTSATVSYWSSTEVNFTVPSGAPAGKVSVTVTKSGGGTSNAIDFNKLSGPQVPVTFTVNSAPSTAWGENVFLTGNVFELGNWSTDKNVAIGRLLAPNYPNWFGMASLPASTATQYKFIIPRNSGSVTWEGGSNHTYTTPSAGNIGTVTVTWQN
jgi:glycosidase